MKYTMLRRTAALVLALVLALSLAACGGGQNSTKPDGGTAQGSSGKLDLPKKENPAKTDTPAPETPEAPVTTPEEPAEFAFSESAQAALDDLVAHGQQEYFAAAVLGDREEGDIMKFSAWLSSTNPRMTSIWPFLTEIPEEDILGDHGQLYCVVPLVESARITVKHVEWNYEGNGSVPIYSDPLYYGEVGKPFLMYVNYSGVAGLWDDDPDMIVEYEQDDGFVASWFPKHEEGCIYRPYANDHDSVMDFSLLYDVGDYIPYLYDGPDADSEWLPPTDLGLAGTTWYSDNGWVLVFGTDGSAEDGMVLYQPEADGTLTICYQGTWWMEDDSLCLGVYEGHCPFPLLISPSGEQLVVMQADDGSVLPFFEKGQTTVGMTLSYG